MRRILQEILILGVVVGAVATATCIVYRGTNGQIVIELYGPQYLDSKVFAAFWILIGLAIVYLLRIFITKACDILINTVATALVLLLMIFIYMQITWLKGFEMHLTNFTEGSDDPIADGLYRDRMILHGLNLALAIISLMLGVRTFKVIRMKKYGS